MYCTLPTAINPEDFTRRLRRARGDLAVVVLYDGIHPTLFFTSSIITGTVLVVGRPPWFLGQLVTFNEFLQELRES